MTGQDLMGGVDLNLLRLCWVGLFLLFLGGAAAAFRVLLRRRRTHSSLLRGLLLVATVLLLFFVLELCFAFLVRQSDGYGHTLASRLWFARYWRVNADGYRDREHGTLVGRRVLVVVGDSFAAGHGIADPADRFADRLCVLLDEGLELNLLARNGWDSGAELEALRSFPFRAEIVVVSYFVNDIQGAADRLGWPAPPYVELPRGPLGWVVSHSFLVDWIYWRLQRHRVGDAYWRYLVRCFDHPGIWFAHAEQLQGFVDTAAERRARLCVLLWPDLGRLDGSAPMTARVGAFFRARGVALVDMTDVVRGWSVSARIVNPFDPHPSRALHREAADRLAAVLEPHPR